MKFKIVQDNVLVRPEEVKEKTAGGIIIPDSAKSVDVQRWGEVVAVGHGFWVSSSPEPVPLSVKVGDKISYWGNLAKSVDVGGETLHQIKESAVIAVVE